MFLNNNLWTIFEVAREERTDGDADTGDLGSAADRFVNCLESEGQAYRCMDGLDKPALLAEWTALGAEKQVDEMNAYEKMVDGHYTELCRSFTAGDREAFEAVVAGRA